MKSDDLSSDFDRILLTPVMGNHQLLGRRKALVLSRYTPPNILLIDFRETVSRCADEVTNWLKLLIPRARSPCSLRFGLLYFLLLCISTRVEEWKISITLRKSRSLLKFEKYNTVGCYVEIAPIWNAIKLVWLLASEKIHFLFFSNENV